MSWPSTIVIWVFIYHCIHKHAHTFLSFVLFLVSLFFSLQYWGLNLRPCTCFTSSLPIEPYPLVFSLLDYFSDRVSHFYLGWLGTQSSYLYLLSSWDHRCMLSHLGCFWDRVSLTFPLGITTTTWKASHKLFSVVFLFCFLMRKPSDRKARHQEFVFPNIILQLSKVNWEVNEQVQLLLMFLYLL
jgi:hypothetical protein